MHEDCGQKATCPCYKRRMADEAAYHFQLAKSLQAQSGGHRTPKKAPVEKYDWSIDEAVWALKKYFPKMTLHDIIEAVKDVPGTTEERYLVGLQKLGRVKA